jgi:hypothetical protein
MPRVFWLTAHRVGVALGLVLSLVIPAAPAVGQTTIFSSGGFESYANGDISNAGYSEQPFFNTGGVVQTATVLNGTKAFQAIGSQMTAPGLGGANWWYQTNFNVNPVALGTPFVQLQYAGRFAPNNSGFFAMPEAGVFIEGLDSGGTQHAITTVTFFKDGNMRALTSGSLGGAVSTVNSPFTLDTWHEMLVELNYSTQTFRVYRKGQPAPLEFQTSAGLITDLPFADANRTSPFVTVFEFGMEAFNFNLGGGSELAPEGNFFVDDFLVTRSATSLAPVPEPGLMLAVGAAGLAGWRVYRRRKTAI